MQVGMDTAESHQSARSSPEASNIRKPYPFVITHNHMGDSASAGDQQSNLSLYFRRKGGKLAG
jgi:hypothetical protein